MKAAVVVQPGKLEIREIPEPEINDYQVLVEQLACGVCTGTDWKLLEGHFKGFHTYPAVLGHEAVGRVIKEGKRFAISRSATIYCGRVLKPLVTEPPSIPDGVHLRNMESPVMGRR